MLLYQIEVLFKHNKITAYMYTSEESRCGAVQISNYNHNNLNDRPSILKEFI